MSKIKNKMIYPVEEPLLSCIGKVEFWYNDKARSRGSGSIIQSPKFTIVATAAHCLYDWETKSFFKRVSFLPYLEKFKISYKPTLAVIPKDWSEGIVDYDTGFLVFTSMSSQLIDYKNYAIPIEFNLSRNLEYILIGFQNFIIPSRTPLISRGVAHEDIYKNSTLQGLTSKGKSGMSGGPWFTKHKGQYIQNSLTSLSMKSVKNTLWSPYWGNVIEAAYKTAIGEIEDDPRILTYHYQ